MARGVNTKSGDRAGPDTISRSARIRTQRIPDQMAMDIRKRILRGDLEEGGSLPAETELMAQYGVSRPTLREALRILDSEQLIRIRRGGIGGALVQRPSLDAAARQFGFVLQNRGVIMADAHRARTVIEPPALAALANTITPAQLVDLNEKLASTNEFIGDPLRYSKAVEAIREEIVTLTGQFTLALIMRLLREVIQRHTAAIGGVPEVRWAKLQRLSQKSHQRLLDLIGAGDPEGAEAFWRQHLDEVAHHLGRAATAKVIDLLD